MPRPRAHWTCDGLTVALIAGTAAAVMGAAVFVAQAFALIESTTWVPRITTVAMFALAGVGLIAATRDGDDAAKARRFCGSLVLIIAAACLIDRIVAGHMSASNDGGAISPLPTVVAFLLVGASLFQFSPDGRARSAYLSAAAVGSLVFTGVASYALGLRPSDSVLAGMSPTSLVFLGVLTVGILSLWPSLPPFSWIERRTAGARLAMRLVPVMLLLPLALALMLPYWTDVTGLPEDAGLAVAVALLGVVLTGLTAISVRVIDEAEQREADVRREAELAIRESEERFRSLAVEMPAGVISRNEHGAITFANDEAFRIFGLEPGEDLAFGTADMAHPDDTARARSAMERTMKTGEPFAQETRIVLRSGEVRWVNVRGTRQDDADGNFASYLSMITDVTDRRVAEEERRDAEQALARSEALHRLTMHNLPNATIGLFDRDLRCLLLEGEWTSDEFDSDAARGKTASEVGGAAVGRTLAGPMAAALDGTASLVEHEASSSERISRFAVEPFRGPTGEVEGVLIVASDITEARAAERKLEHLAHHDPLTGLLNRRAFEARLHEHTARVARYGATGAMLMIDLDGFKGVNDTLGHAVGDALIAGVAGALRERLRETDVVARLGGDEFAVILPEESGQRAADVGESLLRLIRENAKAFAAGAPKTVSASIGVADFAAGISADDTLSRADQAMYAAKQSGKSRVVAYEQLAGAAATVVR